MDKLADLTTVEFAARLADSSPAPGGGSVAAYAGSLSASLCAMVARLTVGKKKYAAVRERMEGVVESADALSRRLLELMDADTDAYNGVVAAFRLPRETPGEKEARRLAVQDATRRAAEVPLETLRAAAAVVDLVEAAVVHGNPNCVTDAGTAVQLLLTAATAAAYNVRINIAALENRDFAADCETETVDLTAGIRERAVLLEARVTAALAEQTRTG